MTPLELAAMLITAATTLKDAGMPLEKDPSKNFSDLATLVAIAYGENEQGDRIGTGQSTLTDEEGNREISFGPFKSAGISSGFTSSKISVYLLLTTVVSPDADLSVYQNLFI